LNYIKTFKISKLALATGMFTSSIVYVTVSNTGEFTACLADNSIKLSGIIGSGVIRILYGDISSIVVSTTTNKLADYVKTNIKTGSQLTAIGTSTLVGFITILLTIILEFTYTQTKTYLLKDNQLEVKDSDFEMESIDDFEIITLKQKEI
jgi:hypothetical protein